MKQATAIKTATGVLPFSFGMAALAKFCRAHGMTLQDLGRIGEGMEPDVLLSLVWHGFADGHRLEGKGFALTTDDIGDLIDENTGLLEKCMQVFAGSMPQADDAGNGQAPRRIKARH
jgi:hypothetical protein